MGTIGQMAAKLHRIKLSKSERRALEAFRDQKRSKASGIMRAVAFLLSDVNRVSSMRSNQGVFLIIY